MAPDQIDRVFGGSKFDSSSRVRVVSPTVEPRMDYIEHIQRPVYKSVGEIVCTEHVTLCCDSLSGLKQAGLARNAVKNNNGKSNLAICASLPTGVPNQGR